MPPEIPGQNLEISDECANLPGKIPMPALKKGENAKKALGGARSNWAKLNDRHDAKDECYRDQRQRLAGQS